jgi:hypothetical protein
MSAKVFLDTNILIYLLEGQQPGTVSSKADQEANRKDPRLYRTDHNHDFGYTHRTPGAPASCFVRSVKTR